MILMITTSIPRGGGGRGGGSAAVAGDIIVGTLAIIRQRLVGFGKLLEFEGGGVPEMFWGIGMLVWVELHCQASKGLLDFLFARVPLESQNLVVIHIIRLYTMPSSSSSIYMMMMMN